MRNENLTRIENLPNFIAKIHELLLISAFHEHAGVCSVGQYYLHALEHQISQGKFIDWWCGIFLYVSFLYVHSSDMKLFLTGEYTYIQISYYPIF